MKWRPNRYHTHWTPARQAWLETLAHGPAVRPKNPVGWHCMELGWTRWTDRAAKLETLTDAGRAVLAEFHKRPPSASSLSVVRRIVCAVDEYGCGFESGSDDFWRAIADARRLLGEPAEDTP